MKARLMVGNSEVQLGIYIHRVLIVNWSLFNAQLYGPFTRDGSIFTGRNMSGKSTAVDAILTVLLASTSQRNYNQAALIGKSGGVSRNFKNYILGKKPESSKPGIREGMDFTSHIVIEFRDAVSKSNLVFGMSTDYRSQAGEGSLVPKFFSYEGSLPDCLFLDDEDAMSVKERNLLLESLSCDGAISDLRIYSSNSEARQGFRMRMGFTDPTTLDALKHLAALEKNLTIDDFIYRYLCPTDDAVSTDLMFDVLGRWDQCQRTLATAKSTLDLVESEIESYEAYARAVEDETISRRAYSISLVKHHESELEEADAQIAKHKEEQAKILQAIEDAEYLIEQKRIEIQTKKTILDSSDKAADRRSLSDKLRADQIRHDDLQEVVSSSFDMLMDARYELEKTACSDLGRFDSELQHGIAEMAGLLEKAYEAGQGVYSGNPKLLREIIASSDKVLGRIETVVMNIRKDLHDNSKERKEAEEAISQLKAGIIGDDKQVARQVSFLENELGYRPVHICDAVDIVEGEEAWRLAVEGVLGNKRLALLVKPKDYFRAQAALRRFEGRPTCWLINTSAIRRLAEGKPPKPGALSEKVVALPGEYEIYARAYIDFTLGRTICCRDYKRRVAEDPATNAVTPEGDWYVAPSSTVIKYRYIQPFRLGSNARAKYERAIRAEKLAIIAQADSRHDALATELSKLEQVRRTCLGSATPFGAGLENAIAKDAVCADLSREIAATRLALDDIDDADLQEVEKQIFSQREEVRRLEQDNKLRERNLGNVEARLEKEEADREKAKRDLEKAEATSTPLEDPASESEAQSISADRPSKLAEDLSNAELSTARHWEQLISRRREIIPKVGFAISCISIPDNDIWTAKREEISKVTIPEYESEFALLSNEAERGFVNDLVSKLNNGISRIKRTIRASNRILKNVAFGDIHYEFECKVNPDYRAFYDMIMDPDYENAREGLFAEGYYERHRHEIDEFMEALKDSRFGESDAMREQSKKRADELLDFKSYLKFDMKEIRDDGSVTSLRRGLAAGSGSEQALPYYVVLAASLASKMKTDRSDLSGHTLRSVLIDEAFANVDDEKACNMIKMLQGMGLQPILVIPDSERINRFCMLTGSAFYHQRIGNERFEVALFGEDEDFYE